MLGQPNQHVLTFLHSILIVQGHILSTAGAALSILYLLSVKRGHGSICTPGIRASPPQKCKQLPYVKTEQSLIIIVATYKWHKIPFQ
jgi:hypothetical protein